MPRGQIQPVEMNSFVGGLNTEAGPLNFPPNATVDEVNFSMLRDGSRRRRKGVGFEAAHALTGTPLDVYGDPTLAVGTYIWTNVANTSREFLVVQVGNEFRFYDNNVPNPSANPIQVTPLVIGVDTYKQASLASLFGRLVVAIGQQELTVLEYSETSNNITATQYRLSVRDLWGIEDGVPEGVRPTSLTHQHRYNLLNQGWPDITTHWASFDGSVAGAYDPAVTFQTVGGSGTYPSNSDLFHAYRGGGAREPALVDKFNPYLKNTIRFGTAKAPKGSVLLDLFNRSASRIAEYNSHPFTAFSYVAPGIGTDVSYGGVTHVAAYGGRIFYAIDEEGRIGGDVRSPNLSTMIFFSQVAENIDQLAKCHAQNDPSNEDLNAPLDTDGGFVTIAGIGKILKMVPIGQSLFIFADNGVWEINGGDKGFSATSVNISVTTTVGAAGANSIVPLEGGAVYWSKSAIHQVTLDPVSLRGSVSNITDTLIRGYMLSIPYTAKKAATGIFLPELRQVRWLYTEGETPSPHAYNKELIFDMTLNAFSVNQFFESDDEFDGPFLGGYIPPARSSVNTIIDPVTVNGVQVTSGGVPVFTEFDVEIDPVTESLKYLVLVDGDDPSFAGQIPISSKTALTVGELNNADFRDWDSVAGVDAAAFMLTGAFTGGESQRKKQVPYITTHMELTDELLQNDMGDYESLTPSSCLLQGQWEWTNDVTTGRWTAPQQIYRMRRMLPVTSGGTINFGNDLVVARTKLRGSGRSLSLLFSTEPGKDCHLYGWALNVNINEQV